ncbi:hypothetical protein ACHAXR_012937 [Thalassiosira sp. AJA248-18]
MRRRQATNETPGNGIFILGTSHGHPSKFRFDKYHGRPRNRRSTILLFGALAIISASWLSTTLKPTIGNSDSSNDISGETKNSTAPLRRRISPPTIIPRRLIFTYKYNLLAPSDDDPPFDEEDPLTANVLHTIDQYKKYWNTTDQDSQDEAKEKEVVVSFLSDNRCLRVIKKAEPRLVRYFYTESKAQLLSSAQQHKADICRAAELYLYGGYYFDIDIAVIEPLNLNALDIPSLIPDPMWQLREMKKGDVGTMPSEGDVVTFSTVYNKQGRFFQAFTAVTPRHPMLKRSFDYMVAYYEGSSSLEKALPQYMVNTRKNEIHSFPSRRYPQGNSVGPYALSLAYRLTPDREWEDYVRGMMKDHHTVGNQSSTEISVKRRHSRFLYEISLEDEEMENRESKGCVIEQQKGKCSHGHQMLLLQSQGNW